LAFARAAPNGVENTGEGFFIASSGRPKYFEGAPGVDAKHPQNTDSRLRVLGRGQEIQSIFNDRLPIIGTEKPEESK